jgi:hypothetical protein
MTPLNSAAIIGVSLAPSADLLKSLFAPSGSVTQRGKRMRARLDPYLGDRVSDSQNAAGAWNQPTFDVKCW